MRQSQQQYMDNGGALLPSSNNNDVMMRLHAMHLILTQHTYRSVSERERERSFEMSVHLVLWSEVI